MMDINTLLLIAGIPTAITIATTVLTLWAQNGIPVLSAKDDETRPHVERVS